VANWYCGREAAKRASSIWGVEHNPIIARAIESASRDFDRQTRRFFIPKTETRLYRWPPRQPGPSTTLWLDQDLISVTTLQSEAQNASPTTIASSDFFLEPNNQGPPYHRVEIDLSSTAAFQSGDTPQRSISVVGDWGYSADTKSAGTVASGLASDAAATELVCSDGSLVDVGSTILIESERLFITEKAGAALGSKLIDGALVQNKAEVAITLDSSPGVLAGEVMRLDSELMLIQSISGTTATVIRAYDGSVLATHSDDTAIHIFRTLTVERGANGSTAATHANSTAISIYEPPFNISEVCMGRAIASYHQQQAGWGRTIGPGEAALEFRGISLNQRWDDVVTEYRRYSGPRAI
jgi:hypothetical protein